jgi:hypothetical protein
LRREAGDHGNAIGVVQYEIDLHADSPHFHCNEYTFENCDVITYSTGYKPIKGVSIGDVSML